MIRMRPPIFLGAATQRGGQSAVGAGVCRSARPVHHGTMLPDYGGRIRAVVLQYASGSQYVAPTFKEYLQWQSPDLTVYMASPGGG